MKNFFKNVFASTLGVLIASCIIGFGLFLMTVFFFIAAIGSSMQDNYKVEENTILKINLAGEIQDRVDPNPFLEFLDFSEVTQLSLKDILSAIRTSKTKDEVKGIYIYSGALSASSASLNEIRDALIDFKKSGKFIVSYSDAYMQGAYFLSSVADKVLINPEGMLDLHGISANLMFYKGTFDKIGVDMQIFKVGTYKSAVEPYISTKMSDANREQITSYINSVWGSVLDGISKSRNIPVEKLNEIANALPALQTKDYLKTNNLVDSVMYKSGVENYLKHLLNIDSSEDLNIASVKNLISTVKEKTNKNKSEIAVLYAQGMIVSGNSNEEINDGFVIQQLKKLADNDNVKAVVFRVNSRGGSAYASEQIWKAVTDLKKKKPIYVSMGDYAASGGYYISANATKIYAQPTTLTGSIGIYGVFPNIEGLTQKLGLSFDQVKTNEYADFGDINRPMRDGEKVILQSYIERGYDLFLTRCATGRDIPKEKLDSIAQGRVWTGEQALKLGLVDEIGGIDDAIKGLAKLLSLTNYNVKSYPEPANPFASFLNLDKNKISTYIVGQYLDTEELKLFKNLKQIKQINKQDFIQAKMPYEIDLK